MAFMRVVLPELGIPTRHTVNSFAAEPAWTSCVAVFMAVLFDENPGGFTLAQSQKRAADADHQWVSQGSGMRNGDFFARRKAQILQSITIFARAIESFDTA